jgi:hypothetical protein
MLKNYFNVPYWYLRIVRELALISMCLIVSGCGPRVYKEGDSFYKSDSIKIGNQSRNAYDYLGSIDGKSLYVISNKEGLKSFPTPAFLVNDRELIVKTLTLPEAKVINDEIRINQEREKTANLDKDLAFVGALFAMETAMQKAGFNDPNLGKYDPDKENKDRQRDELLMLRKKQLRMEECRRKERIFERANRHTGATWSCY